MPDKLKSLCKLFADDTNLATTGDNDSRLALQEDINSQAAWSNEWLMEFNEEKCCIKIWKIKFQDFKNIKQINEIIIKF